MSYVDEERLGRRPVIAIAAAGLVTGIVALIATMIVFGNVQAAYQAQGLVAMTVSKKVPPDQTDAYQRAITGGEAGRVAAAIFELPRFVPVAAQAAGVTPESLRITAEQVEKSRLVSIAVTAPSPAAAEAAAKAVITAGTPVVQQVWGPFDLPIVQDPAGTAVPATVPVVQLLLVALLGGILVGSGAALFIVRARSRSDDHDDERFGRPPAGPPARPMPSLPPHPAGAQQPPRR
ncbi:MAG: hypothetical protein L0H84_22695 [Pseudonocardia sp.]|nr:hypothetical protein [Pseudonocardia sp.]